MLKPSWIIRGVGKFIISRHLSGWARSARTAPFRKSASWIIRGVGKIHHFPTPYGLGSLHSHGALPKIRCSAYKIILDCFAFARNDSFLLYYEKQNDELIQPMLLIQRQNVFTLCNTQFSIY